MILLDTCALIWLSDDVQTLSPAACQEIRDNVGQIFVSAISAFEIGVKCRKQRLALPQPPRQWFEAVLLARGIRVLGVDWRTAIQSTQLPPLHADPCDRIIIATAQARRMPIVTPDPLIRAYPDTQVVW